jgi:hypothetical protein
MQAPWRAGRRSRARTPRRLIARHGFGSDGVWRVAFTGSDGTRPATPAQVAAFRTGRHRSSGLIRGA